MFVEEFNIRLKKALELRNMRPIDLASKAKIDKAKISCWLSGKFKANQKYLTLIAKALDVSEAWLMGYDVPMERNNNFIKKYEKLTKKQQDNILEIMENMDK